MSAFFFYMQDRRSDLMVRGGRCVQPDSAVSRHDILEAAMLGVLTSRMQWGCLFPAVTSVAHSRISVTP